LKTAHRQLVPGSIAFANKAGSGTAVGLQALRHLAQGRIGLPVQPRWFDIWMLLDAQEGKLLD
jgi:hypothetical protein